LKNDKTIERVNKSFNLSTVERDEDGKLLPGAKCVTCQTGTQPSGDKSQCLPCKQLPTLTPADLVEGAGCNCRYQIKEVKE